MDATTKASRAVLSEYARTALRPIEIGAIVIFVIALIGTVWLITSVSAWWWLLMFVVITYGIIGSLLWLMIHFTMDKLRPAQTKEQHKAVKHFITQLNQTKEGLTQTKFSLLLRVIGDVMKRREQNVLQEFAGNSQSLKTSFEQVIASFR